jgi:hypothetical protein
LTKPIVVQPALVRRLPLQLPKTTTDRLEGAPNVPEYRVFDRIADSYNIDLWVDINNRQPTAATLRYCPRCRQRHSLSTLAKAHSLLAWATCLPPRCDSYRLGA